MSHYDQLLEQFTRYKEESILEKEKLRREVEKCRTLIQKFTEKAEKRFDAHMAELKKANASQLQKAQKRLLVNNEDLKEALGGKDKIIEELRACVRVLESEKRAIMDNNTKMMLEISKDLDLNSMGTRGTHSYEELLKMYQYLLEENNSLKKEIHAGPKKRKPSQHNNISRLDESAVSRTKKPLKRPQMTHLMQK